MNLLCNRELDWPLSLVGRQTKSLEFPKYEGDSVLPEPLSLY